MKRTTFPYIIGIIILLLLSPILSTRAKELEITPTPSLADQVIDAINEVRVNYGENPYKPDPILMEIAQAQADYMASIGTWTHTGPDGTRPYQRAINHGYLVDGDLSVGGLFSEVVRMENDLSPQDVVQEWMSNSDDMYAIISGAYQDVGVGVAIVDRTYYYCLDAGLSTHGTPIVYTPPGPTQTATIIQSTPNADGSITHVVHPGDTLLSISIAYDVALGEILRLNGLTLDSVIYPNDEIIIRQAYTPTPTVPTATASRIPTSTPWPSSTNSPLPPKSVTPTTIPNPNATLTQNKGVVIGGVIILFALITGGVISLLGKRK